MSLFSELQYKYEYIFIQVQERDSGRDCDRCWILCSPHATHYLPEEI